MWLSWWRGRGRKGERVETEGIGKHGRVVELDRDGVRGWREGGEMKDGKR